MHHLSSIQQPAELDRAQPSNACVSLTSISSISRADGMALTVLMKQVKDRYIKQQIPETTQEMYLAEWEEMVLRYGLVPFRDALLKVIRDDERAPFFPEPDEIRKVCRAAARAEREREETKEQLKKQAEWKATWERERAADLAAGIPRGTDPEAEMKKLIARRPLTPHPQEMTHEQQLAWIERNISPAERNAVRQRMNAVLGEKVPA